MDKRLPVRKNRAEYAANAVLVANGKAAQIVAAAHAAYHACDWRTICTKRFERRGKLPPDSEGMR